MRVRNVRKRVEDLKETAPRTEVSPLWVPRSPEPQGGASSLPRCSPLHSELGRVKAEPPPPHEEQPQTALRTPLAGPTPPAR